MNATELEATAGKAIAVTTALSQVARSSAAAILPLREHLAVLEDLRLAVGYLQIAIRENSSAAPEAIRRTGTAADAVGIARDHLRVSPPAGGDTRSRLRRTAADTASVLHSLCLRYPAADRAMMAAAYGSVAWHLAITLEAEADLIEGVFRVCPRRPGIYTATEKLGEAAGYLREARRLLPVA